MLSEAQFKSLYTGRLTLVDQPDVIGLQLFGIIIFKFKHEMFAEQRVRSLALLQKITKEYESFSIIFMFPFNVEFSGLDLNNFKEIYVLLRGVSSQFSIICGPKSSQKLKSFSRTKIINIYTSLSEALLDTTPQNLISFPIKTCKNVIVFDSELQLRDDLVDELMANRYSAVGVSSIYEALKILNKFDSVLDGALFEFLYPGTQEVKFIKEFRKINPKAILMIYAKELDDEMMSMCQEFSIASLKSYPFHVSNIIRKFKAEFPEN